MARSSLTRPYFLYPPLNPQIKFENDENIRILLNKCKVTQLKVILQMYKMPVTGLKANLIKALMEKWERLSSASINENAIKDLKNQNTSGAIFFYFTLFVVCKHPTTYNNFIPNGMVFYHYCVEYPNTPIYILFARALIKCYKCTCDDFDKEIFPNVTKQDLIEPFRERPHGQYDNPYDQRQNVPMQNQNIPLNRAVNLYSNMTCVGVYDNETLMLLNNFDYIKSPFFSKVRSIKRQILPKSGMKQVEIIKFQLSESDVDRLNRSLNQESPYSFEILLYCAPIKSMMSKNENISFPSPIEIKINSHQVSDYIRGIKDKPDTAQPARLTEHIIKETLKDNIVQITFLRTQFQYVCNVYLVRSYNGLQLYNRSIKINEHIDKATTIAKAQQILKEDDEELQMETMRMSLQCPISYSRMKFPVRSKYCNHIQCFDAQWYLEAQRQVPLWECPVCQDKIKLSDIRLCDYTAEILANCKNDDDEQVEITKDGTYKYLENDMGDDDYSDDEMDGYQKNEKTYFGNATPKKKSELEPEVINLISDDDEEEEEEEQASVHVVSSNNNNSSYTNGFHPIQLPILTTAESEERVGNIAPEPQDDQLNSSGTNGDEEEEEEEMPSLRNDGRDLTASLAQHFNLNSGLSNGNHDSNGQHNITPPTQVTSSTQSINRPNENNVSITPVDSNSNKALGNFNKRRASTELTREAFIDLTGDD